MNGAHVAEVYSQPRVTAMAPELGLSPGFALDLLTLDPEDTMPWDFARRSKMQKAMIRVKTENTVLIGSPMCKAFNTRMALNRYKLDPGKYNTMMREARKHEQLKGGCQQQHKNNHNM